MAMSLGDITGLNTVIWNNSRPANAPRRLFLCLFEKYGTLYKANWNVILTNTITGKK